MTRARDTASSGGLVLVNQTNFSAASTISLNNIFSSTYDNYRVIIDLTSASASSLVTVRLIASGTASTSAYYYGQTGATETGSTTNTGSSGDSSRLFLWDHNSTYPYNSATMDVVSPFLTKTTKIIHQTVFVNSSSTVIHRSSGMQHSVLSSYDGLQFNVSSGNITGTVQIYGYRK